MSGAAFRSPRAPIATNCSHPGSGVSLAATGSTPPAWSAPSLADGDCNARKILIDDAAPPREDIMLWARACGVDPERVSRLTLARRRPERPRVWFSSQGPPWAPTAMRSPPVCCACFESDRAAGRDDHLRAEWMLAERCVCPAHRQLLRDRCPRCRGRLHFGFRLRDGRARVVCGECAQELAARSAGEADGALIEALISLQDSDRRDRARPAARPQAA